MAKRRKTPTKPAHEKKSLRYPYNHIRTCLQVGSVVKDQGGELAFVPKPVIAKKLGKDESGSAFSQLVASTKTFGIVEGGIELKLTELGREYFFPVAENSRRAAELEFLSQPAAFQYLLREFDGSRLPAVEMIAN